MLGHRCSNGKLFMYGMANEGRLGVRLGGGENALPEQSFKAQLRGLQLVQFPEEVFSQSSAPVQIAKVECSSSFTIARSNISCRVASASNPLCHSWSSLPSGGASCSPSPFSRVRVTYSGRLSLWSFARISSSPAGRE